MLTSSGQDGDMARRTPTAPRTGRRPAADGASTKERILDEARAAFASEGYAGTSLRQVARTAGVDPALVVHFFDSKAGLFIAAMRWPFDPATEVVAVTADGPDQVGHHLVRAFVGHWEDEQQRSPILDLLHAATADPRSAATFRDFLQDQLLFPLVERLGLDHPALRANLISTQLVGLGMTRYVLRIAPFADAPADDVIALVGNLVQHCCTAPMGKLLRGHPDRC